MVETIMVKLDTRKEVQIFVRTKLNYTEELTPEGIGESRKNH
jgi:hypothetical protein